MVPLSPGSKTRYSSCGVQVVGSGAGHDRKVVPCHTVAVHPLVTLKAARRQTCEVLALTTRWLSHKRTHFFFFNFLSTKLAKQKMESWGHWASESADCSVGACSFMLSPLHAQMHICPPCMLSCILRKRLAWGSMQGLIYESIRLGHSDRNSRCTENGCTVHPKE